MKRAIVLVLLVALLPLCGCQYLMDMNLPGYTARASDTQELTLPAAGLTGLTVQSDVAGIEITPTDGDTIKVTATIECRARSKEIAQSELERVKTTLEAVEEDGRLTVTYPGQTRNLMINATLRVQVPVNLVRFTVHTDVGAVELRDLTGAFNITSDVGAVELNGCALTGDNVISSDVGAVELTPASLGGATSLTVSSDVGAIELILPKDASCTVHQSPFMQASSTTTYGAGDTQIDLSTDVGSIDVRQR